MRGTEHAPQVVGHVALHAEVDAQVLAQIENQLEPQSVVAEAHEQRRPRHRAGLREIDFRLGEHLLHRCAVKGAVAHVSRGVQHGEDGLLAVGHHRREIDALAVGLDERPAFLRRPGAFLEVELAAEPDIEQHAQQPVAVGQPVTRQVFQQQRQAFLGLEPEIRFTTRAPRLHDVGAARRPRQDGLCAEQVAHADRPRQIGRQHQLARFVQLFGRCRQLLDRGDPAVASGEFQHRGRKIRRTALDLPRTPVKADFRPALLAGMAQRTVGAGDVGHEAFQRAPRRAPLHEGHRLTGPRQHGFGDVLGVQAAADEGLAGIALETEQRGTGRQPLQSLCFAMAGDRRQHLLDFAVRDDAEFPQLGKGFGDGGGVFHVSVIRPDCLRDHVTPAKAGVQGFGDSWIPAFAGMTDPEITRNAR